MFVPHDVPSVAGVPWSWQFACPIEQTILPALQGLAGGAGSQEAPAIHAWHIPLLQNRFIPHGAPLETLPAGAHTATPVLQSYCIFWQELAGVQSPPAAHTTHVPWWQTLPGPVPQGMPSPTVPVAMHCSAPASVQT
jgi:hypothetical protein